MGVLVRVVGLAAGIGIGSLILPVSGRAADDSSDRTGAEAAGRMLADQPDDGLMAHARSVLAQALTGLRDDVARLYFDPSPLGTPQAMDALAPSRTAQGSEPPGATPATSVPAASLTAQDSESPETAQAVSAPAPSQTAQGSEPPPLPPERPALPEKSGPSAVTPVAPRSKTDVAETSSIRKRNPELHRPAHEVGAPSGPARERRAVAHARGGSGPDTTVALGRELDSAGRKIGYAIACLVKTGCASGREVAGAAVGATAGGAIAGAGGAIAGGAVGAIVAAPKAASRPRSHAAHRTARRSDAKR